MKKWFKFFTLSFFSHKLSKEGARRNYSNFFLGFILTLVFIWTGYVLGDILPFGAHYNNSSDFKETVHMLLANTDADKRITIEIQEGVLKAKKHGEEYGENLLINTFENDIDRQNYSVDGYNVVIDSRSADALAEVEAYCVYKGDDKIVVSYEEYCALTHATQLDFVFNLKYTGNELELNDELVEGYKQYLAGTSDENKIELETLENNLNENKITKSEYHRAVYELYFTNYYPDISEYESTSKVPLLRNYYYHQYIKEGKNKYLFVFDDYMAGSFETDNGINLSFYGFYSDMENGVLIGEGVKANEAEAIADDFIKSAFNSITFLSLYAYAMNIFSLIPFIALMPMVVTLLAYSILKLSGVDSINSLGGMFKILGSYVWFSGVVSAVITMIISFFVPKNIITALPLVSFFVILVIRAIVFVIKETKIYKEEQETVKMEV